MKVKTPSGEDIYVAHSVPNVIYPCVVCGAECWDGNGDRDEAIREAKARPIMAMCRECAEREFGSEVNRPHGHNTGGEVK